MVSLDIFSRNVGRFEYLWKSNLGATLPDILNIHKTNIGRVKSICWRLLFAGMFSWILIKSKANNNIFYYVYVITALDYGEFGGFLNSTTWLNVYHDCWWLLAYIC